MKFKVKYKLSPDGKVSSIKYKSSDKRLTAVIYTDDYIKGIYYLKTHDKDMDEFSRRSLPITLNKAILAAHSFMGVFDENDNDIGTENCTEELIKISQDLFSALAAGLMKKHPIHT